MCNFQSILTMPSADPQTLAAVIVALGALVWLYNQIMVATGKRAPASPFPVELKEEFVCKSDHQKALDIIDKRLTSATDSRKKIHNAVEVLGSRVTRVEAQASGQSDALNLLTSDCREFFRDQRLTNNEILKRLPKEL